MLSGAAATGIAITLGLAPAGPAAAATPVCTQAWQMHDPVLGTYINYVPEAAGTAVGSVFQAACQLKKGNSGPGVAGLQVTLVYCYKAKIAMDGQFGDNTYAALRTAQGKAGVTVDGIFGPDTRFHFNYIEGSAGNLSTDCLPQGTPQSRYTFVKKQG